MIMVIQNTFVAISCLRDNKRKENISRITFILQQECWNFRKDIPGLSHDDKIPMHLTWIPA